MKKSVLLLVFMGIYIAGSGQFKEVVLDEKAFNAGEKLSYIVKFGPIVGGNAYLVLRQTYHNNTLVFHARGEGKTVGLAERLYSVKDVFESYFDLKTGLPYKAIRDVKEGTYRKHDRLFLSRQRVQYTVPARTHWLKFRQTYSIWYPFYITSEVWIFERSNLGMCCIPLLFLMKKFSLLIFDIKARRK